MKGYFSIFIFLLFQTIFGQINQDKEIIANLELNNSTLIEAFILIEEKSDFQFYFDENWFSDQPRLTKSFNNNSLTYILGEILKETDFNFVVYDNKVIISKNIYIHTELPIDYFKENTRTHNETIFSSDYFSQIENTENIAYIGKQTENNHRTTFNLSGYIRNESTGEVLPNAIIKVVDKDVYVTSNINGFYSIELPKGYNKIETQLMGYESYYKEIIIFGDGKINFQLLEGAEQLDEVLIESNRDNNIKTAIAGITSIDIQEMKTVPLVLGERDILKIATTLPGITKTGEGSSGYNVRGGRTDQNLILLDNAVIYNPSHFLGFFTAINPFTTGSLDIYKANIPVQFGGRLSSVFDIRTKKGNNNNFAGEGSIGPITANLALEIPIKKEKSSLIVGSRATYSDWVLKTIDEESINNSEASFFDGTLKYDHQLNEKNSLSFSSYYSKDKFKVTSDSLIKYHNRLFSLNWSHNFNRKHKGELTVVNSLYKFDIDYENEDPLNRFNFGYNINETQLKTSFQYYYNKTHTFRYGISSKLYHVEPGNLTPTNNLSPIPLLEIDKEKGLESAIFIADEFKVNDRLLLDIGLRYSLFLALGSADVLQYEDNRPITASTVIGQESYSNNEIMKTYGGPEARLGLRYFLTPSLSIKSSFNSMYQYIHLLSTNTTESPTDIWKLSDTYIKPQQSNQVTLGLYKNIDDENLEISIEGYFKRMNQILDYKVGAELTLNPNIEQELLQGKGKAYGIEFLLSKKKGKLTGWLGYSYSKSLIKLDSQFTEEKVNNGNYFPSNFDKPHNVNIVSNFKLTHRYSFSANFTYQSGRPVTYPVGKYNFAGEEQVIYSDRNAYRIPDYYRLDLGINIEGNHKIKKLAHSFWNISVYNVLGRNNPYSVFFVNENGEIKAYQTSIFSIPIPTITYNFKF